MKVKYIAAACAALCSVGAFAAAPLYNPTTTTPAHVVYIAGASAQKNALLATVPSTVFNSTSHGVLYISGPNGSVGWLGDAKTSLFADGGVTLVVYNSTNGSAAGLNQLITADASEAEANVLALPASGTNCGTTSAVSAPNAAAAQTTCTGTARAIVADGALSDVYLDEFAAGLLKSGHALTDIGSPSTGLEGFGVIANAALYNALLAQNIHDGLLPSSCASATASTLAVGTGNGACQPSIRSTDFASIVTDGGQFNNAVGILPNQSQLPLTVCRRDNYSGTLAAMNMYFLNNVCGTQGFEGSLGVVSAAADNNAPTYTVLDTNTTTTQAEVCVYTGVGGQSSVGSLPASTNYNVGVVSLVEKDSVDSASPNAPFYFVKLDGVSPNYTATGAYDATHRSNLANGAYKFATEMAAYVRQGTSLTSGSGAVVAAIAHDISNAVLSNVSGLAYLSASNGAAWNDGSAIGSQMSKYSKAGNNCAAWQ